VGVGILFGDECEKGMIEADDVGDGRKFEHVWIFGQDLSLIPTTEDKEVCSFYLETGHL
jgi:hypothetical protein